MTEMNEVVGTGIAAIEAAPIVNENTMKWIIGGGIAVCVVAGGYFLYKKATEEPKESEEITEDKDEETK